jgi:excisionase family DNA binding protein
MTLNGDWLTVNEAAKLSGYNPEHVTRLIRQGKITARKFSIVWQVNKESLLAYVAKAQAIGEKRGRKPDNQL